MGQVFGEVAATYDDVRFGYPEELSAAIAAYHGRPVAAAVDLGAGTGKGTEVLVRLGAQVTAVEPDARMAAVLRRRFPRVEVVPAAFEQWSPQPGGADVIGCATAWHWLDAETRDQRVHTALVPRGTLAVFHNSHGYAVQHQNDTISGILQAIDPAPTVDDRPPDWVRAEFAASELFTGIEVREWHAYPIMSKERYLRLLQTFSPFRRHSPEAQRAAVTGLDEAIDGFGGTVRMDIRTVAVLARAVG